MYPRDLQVLKAAKKLLHEKLQAVRKSGQKLTEEKMREIMPKAHEIYKLTGIGTARVQDSLGRIQKFPRLYERIREMKKVGYFQESTQLSRSRLSIQKVRELAEMQGKYAGSIPPFGYDGKKGEVLRPNAKGPVVTGVIQDYFIEGKGPAEIGAKRHLRMTRVAEIVHDHIWYYLGHVRVKEEWFRGAHVSLAKKEWTQTIMKRLVASGVPIPASIRKDWENLLDQLPEAPVILYKTHRPAPGIVRKFGRPFWDASRTSVIPTIQKVMDDLNNGLSVSATSRREKLRIHEVCSIRDNSIYANKIRVQGEPYEKWLDAGVEWSDGKKDPPIPFDKWIKVQEMRDKRPLHVISQEARRNLARENMHTIEVFIARRMRTTLQVAKKLELSESEAWRYLDAMRRAGTVGMKSYGRRKPAKWYYIEKT